MPSEHLDRNMPIVGLRAGEMDRGLLETDDSEDQSDPISGRQEESQCAQQDAEWLHSGTWLDSPMTRDAFPDLHLNIGDIVFQGDRLVISWTLLGTHRGECAGVAPTGKLLSLAGMSMLRLIDGRAVEERTVRDDLGFLRQLGVVLPSLNS